MVGPTSTPLGLVASLTAALTLTAAPALGQTTTAGDGSSTPGWLVSPFRPLDLPAPNRMRTGGGRPGPDYWQQHVAYEISASVDTVTHELAARERVVYTNRSPDTLPFVWMRLDGNLCADESVGSRLDQPPLEFGDALFDFSCVGGSEVSLGTVESDGRPLAHDLRGTTMRVDLATPLAPGGTVELELAWRWTLPESGSGRMGRDGSLYEVAQWYPRMAVYDDLGGWNVDPYIGAGEFYQEFGDYEVSLTVPAGFLVAATGTLRNPADVLTEEQRERLGRARQSATAVAIVTEEEARRGGRRAEAGTRTWRFSAENVRDFAFAMAPSFRWDASDWDGILIQTFYRPEAKPWEEANRMSRETIRYFSERLARYPYPHATTVEGPIEGMEYPMLTFVPSYDSRPDLYFVLTHEFGHEWYPMLVGSNERLHPWMDEGFNTFIDIGSVQRYFPGEAYGDTFPQTPLHYYSAHAIPGREQPMALRPVEQRDLYWAAYFKPALMLRLLRTEVLGVERFDRAFRGYTEAWSFKHPAPADFFRFMEDATGSNLDWFWREWIYGTERLDQAVEGVEREEDGRWAVRLQSRGGMIMPVEMLLSWADGGKETVRLPIEMWNLGPLFVYRTPAGRELSGVEVDPRGVYPDSDRGNNAWRR